MYLLSSKSSSRSGGSITPTSNESNINNINNININNDNIFNSHRNALSKRSSTIQVASRLSAHMKIGNRAGSSQILNRNTTYKNNYDNNNNNSNIAKNKTKGNKANSSLFSKRSSNKRMLSRLS
ncbi:uncharacterized protein ASCRUDRAFT_77419 [Ascoidea rubescens DSM 1968]|uniref:Uncharacterized protein n=1 Tax=Ascoidea rubescens DSM 1968 TaxID=1344418 RepID=A0A1D2VBF9_9ASCO|nr:hypothetical protein ASCRUDRAFT_77419 [Ascoidea rubescens DSM 1968]ODV59008.1 hypothetical protein ASCRUDRAFT_77419 [Ascoidea rubescens DSM 1968]